MRLLLHVCCAPCTAGALMKFEQEDTIHPVLYWNNPNIHPLTEYRARLDAMQAFAEQEHLPLVTAGEYGLRPFTAAVAADPDNRCRHCYAVRLEAAAAHARENGFDAFSTTLLISPYQDADLIVAAGEDAASRHGVEFAAFDFRPYFRPGQEKVRGMDLYLQKYCGCIYSEEERYARKKSSVRSGFAPNFHQRSGQRWSRQPKRVSEGQ